MKLTDRFRQFMIGRYGSDELNITLLILYVVFGLLSTFTQLIIFLVLSYACCILVFYRMFSKNVNRRWKENQKFLQIFGPLVNKIKALLGRGQGGNSSYGNYQAPPKKQKDKNHKIFQCGKCGQKIRVPKGKGKIAITCPNCKQEFIKRT